MDKHFSKSELLALAEDLREIAEETAAKFDALRASIDEAERRNRFWSRDRKYLWRMPVYIWLPLVSVLILLFLLSFYAISTSSA